MPNFALYLIERFLYRIVDFFHHWYIGASHNFLHSFFSFLARLDNTFAVHITIRHFFEPLYKDYSPVGRIMGIVFRSSRVIMGGIIYLGLFAIFLVGYVVWLLIPILIMFLMLRHFFSTGTPTTLPY